MNCGIAEIDSEPPERLGGAERESRTCFVGAKVYTEPEALHPGARAERGRQMEGGTSLAEERSQRCAEGVLRRIFARVMPGIRYRLWDGSEGTIGRPDGTWTLVVRDRDAFRTTFGSHNSRLMAEAFIDERL